MWRFARTSRVPCVVCSKRQWNAVSHGCALQNIEGLLSLDEEQAVSLLGRRNIPTSHDTVRLTQPFHVTPLFPHPSKSSMT